MNPHAASRAPIRITPGPRTAAEFEAFAHDIDQLRVEFKASLNESDSRYIKGVLYLIRGLESAGRALLTLAALGWPIGLLGAVLLGLSKCIDNMEFGHNVMHGQYSWLNDPRFEGLTADWDTICSKQSWQESHNHMHHYYANVEGIDRDFGYGFLRLSSDTPWEPRHAVQAVYMVIVAALFEWAIGIHHMAFDRLRDDREATKANIARLWPASRAKMWRQVKKDYLLWPLLGGVAGLALGQGFWAGVGASLLGHVAANVIRNLWTFVTIFCGHFTDQVHTFDPADLPGESKGQWYLRQCLGSANIQGGKVFNFMTGHLSHQIEHHLFPDLPSRRYAQFEPRVREICARHGVPYNTGRLSRQFATVMWRVLRHSFPGGHSPMSRPATALQATSSDTLVTQRTA
ncbi:fatty acid desaturase family protein [Aquabacterium sp.]|uniref:fatty acid desaturase family protein n=1 Tax=Aquabacterium sp. TaxID=1872578 RepID=UPI003D6C80A9